MSHDPDTSPLAPPVVAAGAGPSNPYASPAESLPTPFSQPNVPPSTGLETRKAGPGILIAILWLIGLFIAQVALTAGAAVVLILTSGGGAGGVDLEALESSAWGGLALLAASQFATAGVALTAAAVHCRRDFVGRLQLQLPSARHWLFALMGVIPVSILASEAAAIIGQFDGFSLRFLADSMEKINAVPLAGVLLFACVFPGLFEELLFRGVIGGGLVQRHGLAFGIAATSLFFGLVHLLPAHIVSAAVIGVFLHLAFVYSRSFWIPVTMHLVNNTLAFVLGRYENLLPIEGYTKHFEEGRLIHVPAPLLACGALAAAWLFLCWRSFRAPEGAGDAPAGGKGRWIYLAGLLITQGLLMGVMAASVEPR